MAFKRDAMNEIKTIGVVKSAIMACYADIEATLGDHPRYREAQYKLTQAVMELEAVLKEVREHATFTNVTATGGQDEPPTTEQAG